MRLFFLFVLLFSVKTENQASDKNVLVLIENIIIRDTHSRFFKSLTGNFACLTSLVFMQTVITGLLLSMLTTPHWI